MVSHRIAWYRSYPQTSEALRFVRELLKGGIEVKSKHRSLLL